MKLVEIKLLKENEIFKKIIDELKIKGLNKIYIKTNDTIDYLDIIISITNFLEENKNVFKRLNKDNYENLVLIVLVELLEEINIDTDEEQLNKIMVLLKNSLLVQKASNFLIKKLNLLCCSKKNKNIPKIDDSIHPSQVYIDDRNHPSQVYIE